jgi:hypothetical protein
MVQKSNIVTDIQLGNKSIPKNGNRSNINCIYNWFLFLVEKSIKPKNIEIVINAIIINRLPIMEYLFYFFLNHTPVSLHIFSANDTFSNISKRGY